MKSNCRTFGVRKYLSIRIIKYLRHFFHISYAQARLIIRASCRKFQPRSPRITVQCLQGEGRQRIVRPGTSPFYWLNYWLITSELFITTQINRRELWCSRGISQHRQGRRQLVEKLDLPNGYPDPQPSVIQRLQPKNWCILWSIVG